MKPQNQEAFLKKDIGFIVALTLVIGSVIGSGIFMKPGKVIAAAGDSNMALLAWLLGGLITLASGLTIAELSVQIPRTGGLYVYLEEVYGPLWGHLCGWVHTVIYGPAVIGALGLYFGSLLAHFFGLPADWKIQLGLSSIALLAFVNCLGTRYGGFIQAAATTGKLIPITLIAVWGLLHGNGDIWNMPSGLATHTGMGAAILATLWAYDGWILVGFVAGEMKDPAKILPRAIVIGLLVVTAAYLSVNMALLHTLPASQITALMEKASPAAAGILFGEMGGRLISIGILVSIFGTLNGKILAFPRLPLAMAERGQLPGSSLWSKVNPTLGTPVYATLLEVCLAALLMLLGDPDRLTDIAIFSVYIFSIMAFVAVMLLRKRQPEAPRSYKVPLYPVIPIAAVIGGLFILATTLLDNPLDSCYSIAITLTGLPVYWWITKRNA